VESGLRSLAAISSRQRLNTVPWTLALISIEPLFRNWTAKERELRGFCSRYPRHWLAHGRLAMLLYQVGRLNDGIEFHRKMIEIDPLIPGPYAFLASAMSSAGRIQEADALLRQAHDRWPAHPLLWITNYNHLLFGGRPQSAASFVVNPETLPSGMAQSRWTRDSDWRVLLSGRMSKQAFSTSCDWHWSSRSTCPTPLSFSRCLDGST